MEEKEMIETGTNFVGQRMYFKGITGIWNRHRIKVIEERFPKGNGETILDIGSGTGEIVDLLRKKGYKVTPTDAVPSRKDIQEIIIKDKLPFEDNSFDIVTAFNVIVHLKYGTTIVEEMKRVARKFVYISSPNFSSALWRYIAMPFHNLFLNKHRFTKFHLRPVYEDDFKQIDGWELSKSHLGMIIYTKYTKWKNRRMESKSIK